MKKGMNAEVVVEPLLQPDRSRPEHGDAPEAVDDARDRGQEVDECAERFASRRGAKKLMNSATATASGTAMTIAIVEDRMVPKARGQT